jgi:hypothetical protein
MSDFEHLRSKSCSSCGVRLDKVKKIRIRRVNDSTLCTKLNSVKNTILIKKDKQPNDTIIKIGDIICPYCINYAYKHGTINTSESTKPTTTTTKCTVNSYEFLIIKLTVVLFSISRFGIAI